MSAKPPVVYIFYGEDDYSIQQAVADLTARLGDPAAMTMDALRLDGRTCSLEELQAAAYALPFLSPRRLVVVEDILPRLAGDQQREQFKRILEGAPASTALILVENRQYKENNWLLRWAAKNEPRVFWKVFGVQNRYEMIRWIQTKAKASGGTFSQQGADALVTLVGTDTRLADQEIQKLLAYNNYSRQVEPEDVDLLCAPAAEGGIFDLVDSMGSMNGPRALRILSQLLADQEALGIFGMIVRQYRLLLQAREILDGGGNEGSVSQQLHLHSFVAGKIVQQARNISQVTLDNIYHKLLEVDEAIKTGEKEPETALNILVVSLTAR